MLSRALSLAAVTLLIGCFAAFPAWAQAQNLEAGKSPSQIFAGTCTACHKSPRGLLKTVSAGSLPGFLRQHYTTSSDMASLLSTFLISNGASDTRYQAKQGADAKPAGGAEQLDRQGRRLRPAPAQEAARPDAGEAPAQGEAGRQGRNGRRLARPAGRRPTRRDPLRMDSHQPRRRSSAAPTAASCRPSRGWASEAGRAPKNCPRQTPPRTSRQRPNRWPTTKPRPKPSRKTAANPREPNRRAKASLRPPRSRCRRRAVARHPCCGPIRCPPSRRRRRRPPVASVAAAQRRA